MFKNSKKFTLLFFLLLFFAQKPCSGAYGEPLIKALTQLKNSLATLKTTVQNLTKEPQIMYPSSIWAKIKAGKILKPDDKPKIFTADCKNPLFIQENSKILPKTKSVLRVMTYNVFMGHNALRKENVIAMHNIISKFDPDILMLEEANEYDFNYLTGYEKPCYQDLFEDFGGRRYGNMLHWKKNLLLEGEATPVIYKAKCKQPRCYIKAIFKLPAGKKLLFYGTHLDVYDPTEIVRKKQIEELIIDIKKSKIPNVIVTGDFNAVRKEDYNYDNTTIWPYVEREYVNHENESAAKNGTPTITNMSTQALETLMNYGFDDCFSIAKLPKPKFTVWTGTVVDFIFLKKPWDFKNLPIAGCYVYYSADSDHMPVIMDIKLE